MQVYKLHPEYTDAGQCYSDWVEDGNLLMKTPHWRVGPVAAEWPNDLAFKRIGAGNKRRGNDCDVLFNPCGLIFSQRVVAVLDPICAADVEWLPVNVDPVGSMFLMHPIRAVPLGPGSEFRQNDFGNVIEVFKYEFANPDELPSCFLIPHPPSSAAGKVGLARFNEILVTDQVFDVLMQFRGVSCQQVFQCLKD
jgi:hypothetical protein